MGLPTFDFMNIIRGIKATVLTTLTSRVGTLFAVVSICASAFAGISALVAGIIFPLVDLSQFNQDLMNIQQNDFTSIAMYCVRLDLIESFLNFWLTSIVAVFSFVTATMISWFVAIAIYKAKSAVRADIQDK